MKKPWSISTTVRNPDRIKGFLAVLSEFEGQKFDEENQIKYQIKLIQRRLYKPTNMNEKLTAYYNSPSEMTEKQATEIFEHMKKQSKVLGKDPGLRGRTSTAPLEKMGLAVKKKSIGSISITNFGKKFLKDEIDIGEVFLRYFFNWSLPNPDSEDFTEKDGFNIRPFIATIRIIHEVNKKIMALGEKPVGVSIQEFYTFIPITIDYRSIPKTVDEIITLRKNLRGKSKKQRKQILDTRLKDKVKEFFGNTTQNKFIKNIENLKTYSDNIIRYFKLTRFFFIRGNGFYVDLEPRRNVEIKALLASSDGRKIEFKNIDSYFKFIDSEVDYPWETVGKLKNIANSLIKDVLEINRSLSKPLDVKKLSEISVAKLDKNKLRTVINELREKRREVQDQKIHLALINPTNLEGIINDLSNIHKKEDKPVELEYLITMCLHAINDALKIQPNYPVGDDNKPTFTAPANVPDIECFYKSFSLICEVTMLTSRNQWFQEGQPVMRHLRDFELKHDYNSICLFIAPRIHRDTFNEFGFANKFDYEGTKQKIIPLTITQFIMILQRVLVKKKESKPITYTEFQSLLETLYLNITKSKNIEEWTNSVNKMLETYASSGALK